MGNDEFRLPLYCLAWMCERRSSNGMKTRNEVRRKMGKISGPRFTNLFSHMLY